MMFIYSGMLLTFALGLTLPAQADSARTFHIKYGHPVWNADSKKIDFGYVILRDPGSGQTERFQLQENAPDAGEFSAPVIFSAVKPEVFILSGTDATSRVRKPFVITHREDGSSDIDIYDTREQTLAALKARRAELKNRARPLASREDLAAANQADRAKQLAAAASRLKLRVDQEAAAKRKRDAQLKDISALSDGARQDHVERAGALGTAGDELYAEGDYAGAEQKFHAAADLNPDRTDFYYKYGVSLYRNQKYGDALIVLETAHVDAAVDTERQFYVGLAHERLGELEAADQAFRPLAAGTDPLIGPSARFYLGELQFAEEHYADARAWFEQVIQTAGSDPRLVEAAQAYLTRLTALDAELKARARKWGVTGVLGLMYDSNVLLAPDNARDQGLPTNVADARILTIGQLDWRALRGDHHEWTASLNENLTNSAKTISAEADPYITNLSLPYSYKTSGYRLTARPAYELLYMDPDGTGSKSLILQSSILTFDNTFVITPRWFSTYTAELRHDQSNLQSSVGPNDEDANRWAFRTNQVWFMDSGRREALVANFGYVLDLAKGTNERYTRWEYGVGYVRPTVWGMSWNLGFNFFTLKYGSADPLREDLNAVVTLGLNKPVRDWVTLGLVGVWTRNTSNQSIYAYSKYVFMTTATFTGAF